MLMCPRTNELKSVISDKQWLTQTPAEKRQKRTKYSLCGKKKKGKNARRDHKS